MVIAVCDDEKTDRDNLIKLITKYCGKEHIANSIDSFASAEDFLNAKTQYDILFMDIYLGGMTGLEAVKQSQGKLFRQAIFTTTSTDHAVEAFDLNVLHYLIKPLDYEKVAAGISRCLKTGIKEAERVIQIKFNGKIVPVTISDIVYVEVFNKLSVIHTNKEEISTYNSLETLFEQLNDERFIKAQRSYLVNMDYIDSFLFDRVRLKSGTEIMLSRATRSDLKAKYQSYLFRLARRNL